MSAASREISALHHSDELAQGIYCEESTCESRSWGRGFPDGEYVNFPGLYENNEQMVRDTFGANLDRLQALKKRYDPTNLFRLNHNIPPS